MGESKVEWWLEHFDGSDLEEVVRVWNRSLIADPITVERFTNTVLLDINFDSNGLSVAKTKDGVVGAAYAVHRKHASERAILEPENGWILFFFVAPEYREQGIGRALLERSLQWLESKQVETVYFSSYTPNYLVPGLDVEAYPEASALLASLDFTKKYEAVAMDRLLADYRQPESQIRRVRALEAEGYEIRPARLSDLVDLLRLAGDHFNVDWERAIREAIVAGMPVSNISLARDPAGELVGWAMHGTYEGITDRFGPFGVLESQRGKGLGKALLHHSLMHMKAAGAHSAWFLWTGERTAAGILYLKENFKITRRFTVLQKTMEEGTKESGRK